MALWRTLTQTSATLAQIDICETRFQAPRWFWLASVLLFIVAITVFLVRNTLKEIFFVLFISLVVSFFSLNFFKAFGTTDCKVAVDNPFGSTFLASDWDWLMALISQPSVLYLMSLGSIELFHQLTKNHPKKNLNPDVGYSNNDSNPGDEGNFRRYL